MSDQLRDALRLANEVMCLLPGNEGEQIADELRRLHAVEVGWQDGGDAGGEVVALREIHLTRDLGGMCTVRVNGREVIRDNGDIIDHVATPDWFAHQFADASNMVAAFTDIISEKRAAAKDIQ